MMKPFSCFLLLIGCLPALAQDKWDLKECIDYAITNNISVRQQDIQAQLSELTLEQSRLSQFPNLNFNSSLGLNTGRSIDLTTNQFTTESIFYNSFGLQSNVEVFNFFSKRNLIAANRLEWQADKAAVAKLKDDIALNVAGSYLQVLLNRQQIMLARLQLEQTEIQLENTRKLVAAGSVPELNAIQFEAQLAQDSSNVVTARGAAARSLLFLKSLLNLDAAAPFDIMEPPVELIPIEPISELQPAYVYEMAIKNLPRQQVNMYLLQAAHKKVASAKGELYPSFSLGASLQTNYTNSRNQAELLDATITGFDPIGIVKGTNDTVLAPSFSRNFRFFANPYGNQLRDNFRNGVGLSMNVPLFNGGIARTNIKRARLNVKFIELQTEQDNQNLKQDIYSAYTDAITAQEKFNAASKAVQTAEKAYDFASRRYTIGLLNTVELMTTQSTLFRARLEQTLARFDYVFKMKVLEFYKGQGLKL